MVLWQWIHISLAMHGPWQQVDTSMFTQKPQVCLKKCETNTSRFRKVLPLQIPSKACSNDSHENIIYCLWSTILSLMNHHHNKFHSIHSLCLLSFWMIGYSDQKPAMKRRIQQLTPLTAFFTIRISSMSITAYIRLFWALPTPAWPLIFVSLSFNHKTVAIK